MDDADFADEADVGQTIFFAFAYLLTSCSLLLYWRGKDTEICPKKHSVCWLVSLFPFICFSFYAGMFFNLCGNILLPTVMGYTTHNYGLYDPQLWVI